MATTPVAAPKVQSKESFIAELAALPLETIGRDTAQAYLVKYVNLARAIKKADDSKNTEMMALMVAPTQAF